MKFALWGTGGALAKNKPQQFQTIDIIYSWQFQDESAGMSKSPPEILYKYRSANPRALEMLAKNEVYFARASEFNDPFDCSAQRSMHDNFREDMAKASASLQLNVPIVTLTNEQVQPFREMINEDADMIESRGDVQGAFSELDGLGILSLSARNDSILMWSHYADFHKGFCIGFANYLDVSVHKVVYSETINPNFLFEFFNRPDATEDGFGDELMREWFLTKYVDWQYEDEWRIIAPAGRMGNYTDICLDRIIFGLNMSQDDRDKIRAVLSGKSVNFFEAIRSTNAFSLEIHQID